MTFPLGKVGLILRCHIICIKRSGYVFTEGIFKVKSNCYSNVPQELKEIKTPFFKF